MGFIADIQRQIRQRPTAVAILAGLAVLFVIYRLFRSGDDRSSDSFSNEELNEILRGDETSEQNEFNIHRKSVDSLAIHAPFMSPATLEMYNYANRGNTLISSDRIRLVGDKPHQAGSIFSRSTIPAEDSFEVELEFKIHGQAQKNGMYGDGLAIWLTDAPLDGGDVFGLQNNWNGMALFLDTFQNNQDKSMKTVGFPYASLQVNDGHQGYYDKGTDGVKTEIAGCSMSKIHNVRSDFSKMRMIYLRESGYLSVDFDVRANGIWRNCFTVDSGVRLPEHTYVGFSGETGDLSHNVDLFKLQISALYDDENKPVKSIGAINEDLNFHLRQEEASRDEADVIATSQRERASDKQRSARRGHSRRRTLTRLHKAEARLKKRIAAENKQKYGHESFLWYLFSLAKKTVLVLFSLVMLYIASIFVRAYLSNRRAKQRSYYKGALL